MITLRLPAVFAYRDLVTRAVATGCKVASEGAEHGDAAPLEHERAEELANAMVSAVGEAFNNVVEHAYAERSGDVEIHISSDAKAIRVVMIDEGNPFDIDTVPEPDMTTLPESGMGLYIIRSFVDELSYEDGPPNVLRLVKKLR
jgi:serine/threonine-protein kinase RsbW